MFALLLFIVLETQATTNCIKTDDENYFICQREVTCLNIRGQDTKGKEYKSFNTEVVDDTHRKMIYFSEKECKGESWNEEVEVPKADSSAQIKESDIEDIEAKYSFYDNEKCEDAYQYTLFTKKCIKEKNSENYSRYSLDKNINILYKKYYKDDKCEQEIEGKMEAIMTYGVCEKANEYGLYHGLTDGASAVFISIFALIVLLF